MENAKISIIVPTYNLEKYLPRCLDSILAQTYQNLEVVVIDDGSTDGTSKVLERYTQIDERVKAIYQDNGGATKARYAGMRQATGNWIAFVDGDDYIDADMYERLIKNAEIYQADISHCGYRMVFPNSVAYYYNTGNIIQQDNLTGIKDLLEGSRIEPGLCNKLFRKELFHGLFDSDVESLGIKINEDLLMNFYLFREAKRSVYEDFCPYHYIIRKGSATTTKKPHHYLDPLRVRKKIYEEIKEYAALRQMVYSRYIYMLINASVQTSFKDISNECHKELQQNCKKALPVDSFKLKVMAIMVGYFRPLYRMIRKAYDMIKKLNHKRDVY